MREEPERSRRPDDEAGQIEAGASTAPPVAVLTVAGELFTVQRGAAGLLEVTWTTGRNPGTASASESHRPQSVRRPG